MEDEKFENPEPKDGESQKEFIARCIPYVKDEHPDWPDDKVQAVCFSIWERKHEGASFKDFMESQGYKLYTESVCLSSKSEEVTETIGNTKETRTVTNTRKMIAIIGDRFMNGGYFSMEELKKCYKMWEGTLHDINHEGTFSGAFGQREDITKFIGYHKNVQLDENNKSVSMELHTHKKTKEYEAWEAFVELCEMAGRVPNVSVTYYGKQRFVKASELPDGANYESEGYHKDDMVPILHNVLPICVSTVLRGKCSDKGGCGIRNTCTSEKCGSESESSEKSDEQKKLDEEIEQKRQELISWLKEDDNSED